MPVVGRGSLTRPVAALRPHPHRGDLIAAAVVPLTVAVVMINVRMNSTWAAGIHLVLTALACGLVLGMGLLSEVEPDEPRAYQVVLYLTGLTLLAVALYRVAQVLGVHDPLAASGTLTWTAAAFAAFAAVPAWGRGSPVCVLVEVVAGGLALEAFVDWVFDPHGPSTGRYVLLLLIAVYVAAHLQMRERRPRHAVQLVNAAGLATIVLALTFVGALPFAGVGGGASGPGAGWELVLVALGFGLVAFASVDRQPGAAYLGFAVLALFAILVGRPGSDRASLVGWPLLLLLLAGAGIAAGLRPLQPLPPEPRSGPDAPTVPVAPAAAGPETPGSEAPTQASGSEAPTQMRDRPADPPGSGP